MTMFIHRLPEKVFVTFTLISYASKFDSGVANELVSVYQGNAGKKLDFKSKLQSPGSLYHSNEMGTHACEIILQQSNSTCLLSILHR